MTNPPPRQFPRIALLALLLFTGLSYSNTLHSPPVFDDLATFIYNRDVYLDNFSLDSLAQIHSGRFGQHRFIPMLSFAVDHLIGQGSIVQFHLTNIIIHLLATTAVFLLAMGLAKTPIGQKKLSILDPAVFGLFVAALWALHPVQTNAVTYLVQRMASLTALFYVTSLAGYLWARTGQSGLARKSGWLVFILAMAGAFWSKENSATLPLAVLLLETIFITPTLGKKVLARLGWQHWLVLAIIVILLLPFAATKISQLANGFSGRHFTMEERLFTELRVVVFYLSLLFLPLPGRLNLDHDFPISHSLFTPATTGLSLLLLIFLVFAALRVRHRHPFIAFGILFFFLNLIIESSIIPLEIIFEHRLYLPSLGFSLVLVALMDWGGRFIPVQTDQERKTVLILGMVIIGCFLAVTTTLRNHAWRDKLTISQDIAAKSPLKPRVHTNLGKELANVGRYEEALAALQLSIDLGEGRSEEYMKAASNIVSIFVSQEKYAEAIERGQKLLENRPAGRLNFEGYPILMASMAKAYWRLGKFDYSLEAFNMGLKIRHPQHTPFLLGGMESMLLEASASEEGRRQLGLDGSAGSIYLQMANNRLVEQDYSNSRIFLTKALAISPDNQKFLALKKLFNEETNKNQQVEDTKRRFEQADSRRGLRFRLYLYLTEFINKNYTPFNQFTPHLLKKAVQLEPDSTRAALRLATWQLQNDDTENALWLAEKHLQKWPAYPPLLELAAKCYSVQGMNKEAASKLHRLLDVYPGHPARNKYAEFVEKYYPSAEDRAQKPPHEVEQQ